jgi:hypothetical protein
MKNELSKLVSTNHFPSVLRIFNTSLTLTDMVVITDKELKIEELGQMLLNEDYIKLMQLVKEKKVEFDPGKINRFGSVQTLQIGEYLIIKNLNNQN